MRTANLQTRIKLQEWLEAEGVVSATHYVPLHSAPAGRRYGNAIGSLHQTDAMAGCLLRLPLYYSLTDAEQDRVIKAVMLGLEKI